MEVSAARAGISVLLLTSACGWSGFEPKDRELVGCWPNCGPDASAALDALPVHDDARADAGTETHDDAAEPEHDSEPRDAGLEIRPLEAALITPNTITFTWSLDRIPAGTTAYVLRYGTNGDAVENGGGSVWGAEDDGNLAYRESPHGPGPVSRTTVLGLAASTTYFARLYAQIPAEGERPIAEGSAHTIAIPASSVEIFAEEPHGEVMREGFQDPALAPRAHGGTRALWFTAGEVEMVDVLSGLAIPVPEIVEERLRDAYVEMFVYVDFDGAPAPTYFIDTQVSELSYSYSAVPARLGWTRLQLALRGFQPMMLGDAVSRFGVAGVWPRGATVLIDDVALWY